MSLSTLRTNRAALAAAPAVGLVLLLAGCGGGTSASASSAPDNSNNAAGANNSAAGNNTGGNGQGRAFPGANGKIADISGKTLQVQSDTTQTAVTYTASTKMSQTVSAAKSDLAVGKCVSVRPVQSTDANAAPTQADDSTPLAAESVSISDPVNGSCNGGFGGAGVGGARGNGGQGFQGRRGQGANGGQTGQAPTGDPNAQGATGGQNPNGQNSDGQNPNGQNPNGQGRGQGARGGFGGGGANGTITKIDGDTVTVESQRPQFNSTGTAGSAASSTPTMTTVTRTVTLSSATTYTKSASASASDLKVGKCVTALGSTDSNGTLAATTIALRPAENGSCTTGVVGGFGGRRSGAGAGAATGTTSS